MLKLKYLFEDLDLARELVQQFHHDDLEPLQYFRISSNAIYPYKYKEQVSYLRMTPQEENNEKNLLAELRFLDDLKSLGYNCIRPNHSLTGQTLIKSQTEKGDYYVSSFARVPGERLDSLEMTAELAKAVGASLGALHKVSKNLKNNFDTIIDKLNWMTNELTLLDSVDQLEEIKLLKTRLEQLSDDQLMGIVHYDFEPDNLFVDGQTVHPIDFNDCMIHFYEMDLINALDELPKGCHNDFMIGYKTHMDYQENKEIHAFCQQFKKLYTYTRIKRSIHEEIIDAPDWMIQLKEKLIKAIS